MQVTANLSNYQHKGMVVFEEVLRIPLAARIPNLTHVYGFEKLHEVMIVLLTAFNNSLNLIRPMNSEQIVSCAHDMVMTTEEDQLSVEDYGLFFKGAREGIYGRILDRLDQQSLFLMLEQYRQQRHEKYQEARYEQQINYKSLPINERLADMFPQEKDQHHSAMVDYLKSKKAEQ